MHCVILYVGYCITDSLLHTDLHRDHKWFIPLVFLHRKTVVSCDYYTLPTTNDAACRVFIHLVNF